MVACFSAGHQDISPLVCVGEGTSSRMVFLACLLTSAQPTCVATMRGQVNTENVGGLPACALAWVTSSFLWAMAPAFLLSGVACTTFWGSLEQSLS